MTMSTVGLVSLSKEHLSEDAAKVFQEITEVFRSRLQPPRQLKIVIIGRPSGVDDAEAADLESLSIVVCDPRAFRNSAVLDHLRGAKWIHVLFAGVELLVDHYRNKPKPKFTLTRAAGHYDVQIAEYVLGFAISRERKFWHFQREQSAKAWRWRTDSRALKSLVIGIVGYGSIGRKIAEIALKFETKVVAYVRSESSMREKPIEGVELTSDLPSLLESCDYIVSILPKLPSTDGFFDGEVFKSCKKKPVFVNVGRGNCVKNETIITALDGWLGHAILDVFEVEPLPTESPLWSRDDVTITPHVAGFYLDVEKFWELFEKNYKALCNGEPLDGIVDWNRGY